MFVIDQLPEQWDILWMDLKMHGHVYIIFLIPTVIQSLLFSSIDSI